MACQMEERLEIFMISGVTDLVILQLEGRRIDTV